MSDAFEIGVREGMEKVAFKINPHILNTSITGAFLGAAVAPPDQRLQYMAIGAAGGAILGRHVARPSTFVGGT